MEDKTEFDNMLSALVSTLLFQADQVSLKWVKEFGLNPTWHPMFTEALHARIRRTVFLAERFLLDRSYYTFLVCLYADFSIYLNTGRDDDGVDLLMVAMEPDSTPYKLVKMIRDGKISDLEVQVVTPETLP